MDQESYYSQMDLTQQSYITLIGVGMGKTTDISIVMFLLQIKQFLLIQITIVSHTILIKELLHFLQFQTVNENRIMNLS